MGVLNVLIQPLMEIINKLDVPIELVGKILGVLIKITKEAIQEIVDLINRIDNIFDVNKFAAIFIKPFEKATMSALDGIKTLASLIFKFGEEGFDDVKDALSAPIQDAYSLVRQSVQDLKARYTEFINDMGPTISRVIDDGKRDIYAAADKIDQTILLIQQDIKGLFTVARAKATDIKQDFESVASTAKTHFISDVNLVGTMMVNDTKDLDKSFQNRLKNEDAAIDLFWAFLFASAVSVIVGLVMLTKSVSFLIAAFVVIAVVALTYLFL